MKNLLLGIALGIAWGVAALPATGHVNVFLPGDAFFSSAAADENWQWHEQDQTLTLQYARYTSWSMFCGRVGYESMELTGVPAAAVAEMQHVREAMIASPPAREVAPRDDVADDAGDAGPDAANQTDAAVEAENVSPEEPRVILWVYDRVFDLKKHPLGLKFNETWVADQERMGHGPVYDGFHDGMVPADWRFAADVPPLAAERVLTESDEAVDEAVRSVVEALRGAAATDADEPANLSEEQTKAIRAMIELEMTVLRRPWAKSMCVMMLEQDMHRVMEHREGATFVTISDRVRRYTFTRDGLAVIEDRPLEQADAPTDAGPGRTERPAE